ncbi:AzlC family ABC transporter permease [Schlegelella sp. S2-27]|uniref:AzlC family ABC transporter permease n=1 Tax=Caldimonas mangrovi TaxID=2944811 RepID=A0ABT0YSW5_9BURK|nr:AzlC family ABC transporter permease [Caldimonas mangrovi]MCM5681820.1 AzlC family ABC transporter permease [Caldimonas mangrovi]
MRQLSAFRPPLVPPGFGLGMQRSAPLALGVAAYGLVWGALAGQAGLAPLETGLMSAAVFAGAAQFVALGFWQGGGAHALPLWPIVVTTLIVNLRFVLMSASLYPMFEREAARRRWLTAFWISDENWALTSAELAQGRGSVGFLLGGGLLVYGAWLLSSVAGRLAGTWLGDPARFGLDFAFTASFLALLLGLWRGRPTLLPWAVAAITAVLAHAWLPGKWYIVVGGLCGSIAGAWAPVRRVEKTPPCAPTP